MTIKILAGILLQVFLTAACVSSSEPDPAADRKSIAAVTDQFQAAECAGSVDKFRSFFTDDLVMMGPDSPPVIGGDSVAALMKKFHNAFKVQVEYNSQEIVVSGDWGFDRGTEKYTVTPKTGGEPIQKTGNYLYIYQRQKDGSWKQSRVISN